MGGRTLALARAFLKRASMPPVFPRASLVLLAALLFPLASCETVDTGNRKCRSRVFATLINPERTCGIRKEVDLRMCEDPPTSSCPTQEPTFLCLASPGDTGYLLELSPCHTLNSLPDGWALADLYVNGVSALPECKIARNRCDGSVAPFVASDETPPP